VTQRPTIYNKALAPQPRQAARTVQVSSSVPDHFDDSTDLHIKDFSCLRRDGKVFLKSFEHVSDGQGPYKINIHYEHDSLKHYIGVELDLNGEILFLKLKNVPVEVRYLAYFI